MKFLSSFLPCLLGLSLASAHTLPEHRLKEEWWKNRFNGMQANAAKGGHDLLFVGDSITQAFENNGKGKEVWDQYYAPRKALNFGISGDRTEHVIWRLQRTDFSKVKPKVAVIMIGTNNTGHNMQAPAEVAEGIVEIVNLLRRGTPQTQILLLGVFPRGAKADDKMRKNNEAINALISKVEDGQMIHYLDISEKFLDGSGVLAKEVMHDHLHPGAKGYQIWAEAMEPKLAELGLPLRKK